MFRGVYPERSRRAQHDKDLSDKLSRTLAQEAGFEDTPDIEQAATERRAMGALAG
jgi:hypothetical protein